MLNLELADEFDPAKDKIICAYCGKRHFPDEQTFFTFYGNVTVGLEGGIIGNNFRPNGTVGRLFFLCRKYNCLGVLLENVESSPTLERGEK